MCDDGVVLDGCGADSDGDSAGPLDVLLYWAVADCGCAAPSLLLVVVAFVGAAVGSGPWVLPFADHRASCQAEVHHASHSVASARYAWPPFVRVLSVDHQSWVGADVSSGAACPLGRSEAFPENRTAGAFLGAPG